MKTIIITRPDDWHVHFRDGDILNDTVSATASHFSRALVMPNLQPALTSLTSLLDYRQRILQQIDPSHTFTPFMTFYLNERVDPNDLILSKTHPFVLGAKLYPAGATTNSAEGARSLRSLYPWFDIMQEQNLVLQIHGETTQDDIFDREAVFIETNLCPLIKQFPKLRIVLEHISTRAAVDFVTESSEYIAATITPQHLLYNRNHLLAGGIRPHYYCLPILKRESDQHAIQKAATSGNPKFFAGTDSAPHEQAQKESACGCAGIYSAPYAVSLYAHCFDQLNQLSKLNDFLSVFGATFYQQPENKQELLLKSIPQTIPTTLPLGMGSVIPIAAGDSIPWSVYENI